MVELILLSTFALGYFVAMTLWFAYLVANGVVPANLAVAIFMVACVAGVPMAIYFIRAARKPPIEMVGDSKSEIHHIDNLLRELAKRSFD